MRLISVAHPASVALLRPVTPDARVRQVVHRATGEELAQHASLKAQVNDLVSLVHAPRGQARLAQLDLHAVGGIRVRARKALGSLASLSHQ